MTDQAQGRTKMSTSTTTYPNLLTPRYPVVNAPAILRPDKITEAVEKKQLNHKARSTISLEIPYERRCFLSFYLDFIARKPNMKNTAALLNSTPICGNT